MSFRRTVQGCAVTCLLVIALPGNTTVHADEGRTDHSKSDKCDDKDIDKDRDKDKDKDKDDKDKDDKDKDDNDKDKDDDCVPVPPPDVPEAPQVLMLSASAALTGGATLLVIRRRAKGAQAPLA